MIKTWHIGYILAWYTGWIWLLFWDPFGRVILPASSSWDDDPVERSTGLTVRWDAIILDNNIHTIYIYIRYAVRIGYMMVTSSLFSSHVPWVSRCFTVLPCYWCHRLHRKTGAARRAKISRWRSWISGSRQTSGAVAFGRQFLLNISHYQWV